jgi:hypothetical protein
MKINRKQLRTLIESMILEQDPGPLDFPIEGGIGGDDYEATAQDELQRMGVTTGEYVQPNFSIEGMFDEEISSLLGANALNFPKFLGIEVGKPFIHKNDAQILDFKKNVSAKEVVNAYDLIDTKSFEASNLSDLLDDKNISKEDLEDKLYDLDYQLSELTEKYGYQGERFPSDEQPLYLVVGLSSGLKSSKYFNEKLAFNTYKAITGDKNKALGSNVIIYAEPVDYDEPRSPSVVSAGSMSYFIKRITDSTQLFRLLSSN